jgi:hypothetical protein
VYLGQWEGNCQIAFPVGQYPPTIVIKPEGGGGFYDARTGMPPGIPEGAMCVQRFDDSLNSAIHITYRISLRSSSMWEPRDPLLKVLTFLFMILTSVSSQRVLFVVPPPSGGPGEARWDGYAECLDGGGSGSVPGRSTT